MLYYETVSADTLALLKKLTALPELDQFYLVGGTSLALQAGHRISVYLDFFTAHQFDTDELRRTLINNFPDTGFTRFSKTGFTCVIQNVKCDFFNWSVPFIGNPVLEDGLRLSSVKDIAAFKLDAITTRKEKKDFYDIDILISKFGFEECTVLYKRKYPFNDLNVTLDALSEIDIADGSEEPELIIRKEWNLVKQNIKIEWQHFFENKIKRKEQEKQQRINKAEELLQQKNKNTDTNTK